MDQKIKFQLKRLSARDDASLIAEMQRVSTLVPGDSPLSTYIFDEHSRIRSSTLRRRFGGWRQALEQAGLASRFAESNLPKSRTALISQIQEIAGRVGAAQFTKDKFISESGHYRSVLREFGSWRNALEAAGFSQKRHGIRYLDEECFENLFVVWVHYGRAPKHNEMRLPPSHVGPKAYILRWGTWLKALDAFVARANAEDEDQDAVTSSSTLNVQSTAAPVALAEPRAIRIRTKTTLT